MPSKKSRLRLYVDESIPVPSVTYLKSKSHSAVHAYDFNLVAVADRKHLKESKKQNRVLIALDRDFYQKLKLPKPHPGVIVLKVSSTTVPSVNKTLDFVLKHLSPRKTKNAVVFASIDKIVQKRGTIIRTLFLR